VNDRTVSVAVPVVVDRGFSYRVPDDWDAVPPAGTRVLVPFGPRVLLGIVRPVAPEPTDAPKDLLETLGEALPADVVRLCEWISDYYVAPIGEVYRTALPGLLTHADARTAALTDAGRDALASADSPLLGGAALGNRARRVLQALADAGGAGLPVARLVKLRPRVPAALAVLADLVARGLAATDWSDASPEPRSETVVRRTDYLRGAAADEDTLQRLVGRSKRRRALLDALEARRGDAAGEGWVALDELRGEFPRVRELLAPLTAASMVATAERAREPDPFATALSVDEPPRTPTPDQAAALTALFEAADRSELTVTVLHGITGSGKTEVYLQLIARVRAQGRGAIVLVPEIALTPQLADRFRARFGDEVAVLHSALTPRQRLDAWLRIRAGERPIVIGARSAVFAPIERLGAIVVDEEHDGSYKQEEGVRYHARDVAIVRARENRALVVLGSATPSLETFFHARAGRWQHLRLRERPTPRPLPQVEILPLSVHRPDPESLMTARLKQAVRDTVAAREQVILFLNRRGFTTALVCTSCGSMQRCPDCSAPSMTYHLARNRLLCHLCGHIEAAPQACRTCGGTELLHGGVGTERVEVALGRELAGVRVLRLDRDATRGRALLDTLAKFRRGDADVLVGTQMLSKGHDFPGVTLVGVLQGDAGLALPDPRAAEHTFQLLTQVAGRAGRGDRPGRVIVQAWAVEHPAIVRAREHDYDGFAAEELAARERVGNPPFSHLALVRVHGPDARGVERRARALAERLSRAIDVVRAKHADGDPIAMLGPVASPIARIDRRTRWQLLLRARSRSALRWVLGELRPALGTSGSGAAITLAFVDVDPQSML
jgi:primosomal protein N' (replication factor Y)